MRIDLNFSFLGLNIETYTAIHVQDLGEIVWVPVEEILWRFSREEFFAVIKDFFNGFCSHQFSKPIKCIIIIFVTFSNAVKSCSAKHRKFLDEMF